MVRMVLFAAGSALLVRISWRFLRGPRSHGFWRFFAFESILALQ